MNFCTVSGSPFVLRVAGAPDASQVVCHGFGLEHGILTKFRGRFVCETKGAGSGQLKVRVHGPKGKKSTSSKNDKIHIFNGKDSKKVFFLNFSLNKVKNILPPRKLERDVHFSSCFQIKVGKRFSR